MKSVKKDPFAKKRKADHIDLAMQSAIGAHQIDRRFRYEPMLSGHPTTEMDLSLSFLGKKMKAPIWVSSMTGGTDHARKINHQLARVCGEFGLGMGLGSCRMLLDADDRLVDFDVRDLIGKDVPLYANLGIAQVESLIEEHAVEKIQRLLSKLRADGLIIHVNPIQEWLQPEGDHIKHPPIETIQKLIDTAPGKYIVKEVGQGMGPQSVRELLKLPLTAIEFAAHGGTNFARLEMLRAEKDINQSYAPLAMVGHDVFEMSEMVNQVWKELGEQVNCHEIIISGGVKTFLDGYFLMNKLNLTGVYGQASAFLQHAQGEYDQLRTFVHRQIEGLKLAKSFLRVV
jgi:isopentenyl-diphosphate delta-isomerase